MTDDETLDRDRKDLRRGAWQILSGMGVRTVARIMLIIFVARLYGVESFGRLGETVAVVELAAALATFGLNKTLLGRLSAVQDKAAERAAVTAGMMIALCVSLLAMLVLWFLWPLIFGAETIGFRFALFGIPLIALAEVALTATRHSRTVAWDTAAKAIIKPWSFLLLTLAGYIWLLGDGAPAGWPFDADETLMLAYVLSLGLTALSAFAALRVLMMRKMDGGLERPDLRLTWGFARESLPIAINETAVFAFRRIDIIILALVAGPAATGVYYLAQQIGTIVEKVRYLFEPMLAPIVAQSMSLETIGYHLKRLCLLVFSVQLAIFILMAILGQPMLDWFGTGFAAGLLVILAILLGEMLDGSFGLCELPMVYRHPLWPPRAVLLALGIEIIAVWALASVFGVLGAAIGFALAMGVLAIVRLGLVWRLYGFAILDVRYLRAIFLAAIAAAVTYGVYQLVGETLPAAPLVSALIFFLLYGGATWLVMKRLQSAAVAETADI